MVHLSRFAEEITWWSNPRFGFVRLADGFSTGSSMMPNKRNPDPAELVRGRTARVIGDLTALLALLKGLPLAYQRDLQEDKLPLFESAATLEASLGIMTGLVETLTVDRDRMRAAADEGFITATSVADALVREGVAVPDGPPRGRPARCRGRRPRHDPRCDQRRGGPGDAGRVFGPGRRGGWPTDQGSAGSSGLRRGSTPRSPART